MGTKSKGLLNSRPKAQKNLGSTTTGLRRTGLDTERDGFLYVPESFNPKALSPLIVMFHAAGGDAKDALGPIKEFVDRTGTIVLAPESQDSNWDVILDGYGADIELVDEGLSDVFALYPIDPKRVAVAGFADGASYAINVGLTNNQLFSHIIAFSPSFVQPEAFQKAPSLFVSHGTEDKEFAIDDCSRRLVPTLKAAGAQVEYTEVAGGHSITNEAARAAFSWFLGADSASAGVKARPTQSKLNG